MKKLTAIITMAVLLCSLLMTPAFALQTDPLPIQTGPSIIGPAGITSAGYLLGGEIGNSAAAEYDTNLPLGEIKTNIKPAPSPDGKAKPAEPEYDHVLVQDDVVIAGFVLEELLVGYDFENAVVAPVAEWTIPEEDGALDLLPGELFVVATDDGFVNVTYNSSADALDIEVMAEVPYAVFSIVGDLEEIDVMTIALDVYVAVTSFYIDMELEVSMEFSLMMVLPEDLDPIIIGIVAA